jgi:signal transduction histidine kinase
MLHDPHHSELFPKLSSEELTRLGKSGREVQLEPDQVIFAEGDPTYHFYVVLEGQLQITKQVGNEEKVLTVHQPGEFTGEISMITGSPATVTGRAVGASRVLEIAPDAFKHILAECSQGAAVILAAMAGRSRDLEGQLRQQEKLAALGRLSAGLAHELNNPAAAGQRAAKQLREMIATVQARLLKLCETSFPPEQQQHLLQLQQTAIAHLLQAPKLDPIVQSDREDTLTDWLENHEISNGWKLSPILISAGIEESQLAQLLDKNSSTSAPLTTEAFAEALSWLSETLTLSGLIYEVEQSTGRISQLVKAIKSYSYMDQAPLQEVDIHEGLENTLTILNYKLKHGITINRQYTSDLPRIAVYGSELNQVWTNLIDNAVHAMQGRGTLTLRTTQVSEGIQVDIMDTGSGISPDIQSRIFEPFFTTKGIGEGSGLGLDIARRIVEQRHHGQIRVSSQPGETCFRISLPLQQS